MRRARTLVLIIVAPVIPANQLPEGTYKGTQEGT